jgi:tellurite resistance protein TerC
MFWMRAGFILLILFLLWLDLGVLNRKAHVIRVKEALLWSAMWIAIGLSFSVFVYFGYQNHWLGLGKDPATGQVAIDPVDKVKLEGHTSTVKNQTGYVIEESLSVE